MFSSDSQFLAAMDSDYGVTLYAIDHKFFDPKNTKEW